MISQSFFHVSHFVKVVAEWLGWQPLDISDWSGLVMLSCHCWDAVYF